MKITFLDAATVGETSLSPIAACGDLTAWPTSSPEEAKERVKDCEVLVVNKVKVTEDLLGVAPNVKLVCEAGTGINNIDVKACEKRGIIVRNVAGYSTEPVVQQTFMHILSLLGNGPYFDDAVKSGGYSSSGMFTNVIKPFIEVYGKQIGIIGMGTIGSRVAEVAEAFGMKVVYYSTSGTGHCTRYPCIPLDELMCTSDVISIHAPYNERTAGLIGEKELRMMKPIAIIVNMGRGGIIEEAALAKVIDENVIGGAALDVFVNEPIPFDNPILHTRHPEKFHFTPHIGWASVEARDRLVAAIADNIRKGW